MKHYPALVKGSNTPTERYWIMRDASRRSGATPTRRAGGWTNYPTIRELLDVGWLEKRHTGPLGGIRYHATKKGRYHLRNVERRFTTPWRLYHRQTRHRRRS